jgi:hypothetical protein
MRILRDERGEGRGKFVVTIVVVVFLGFCLYKFISARVRVFAFKGAVETAVREYANDPTLSPEALDQEIHRRAIQELDFDIPADGVKVDVQTHMITADVNYVIPVDFPLYKWNWQQTIHYEFRRL